MGGADRDVAAAADEIRRYLASHPHASDSLAGIQGWWLTDDARRTSPETVQRALDELVAEGVVASRTLGDGTVVYSARRERRPPRGGPDLGDEDRGERGE